VFSSLLIEFTIPRNLYENEEVQLNMGDDLNDVNTNAEKLTVNLERLEPTEETISVAVSSVNQRM
jgi:hypothetical protein